MRVDLPKASTEFLRGRAAEAVRRSSDARVPWVLGLVAVALAYAPVLALARGPAPWAETPWLLAPFLAAMGWLSAAAQAERRARGAAWLFAAAAAAGLVTQVVWAFEMHVLSRPGVPVAAYLFLFPYVLLAAGAWLALGTRAAWVTGLTVDALLVLLAGMVAVLRLVVEPVMSSIGPGDGSLVVLAALQALGLLPLFLASMLVLGRRSTLAPGSAVALLATTLAFAAAGMLSLSGLDPQPLRLGDPFDWLWLIGWLLLASAGFAARAVPATTADMVRDRAAYDGVRRMIVPGAALFLGVGVVDVALRPVTRPETVVVLALLGAVLALRTAHAFSLTEREDDRKRQLAYTRALVAVTHSLAEATSLDTTLTVISESVRQVLGTGAAGVELVTDDGRTLETRAAVGLPDHFLGTRFPVAGSFTGWVVEHGEPRATADPSRDPFIQPESADVLGRSPFAAAPIRFRGETTGALYACIRGEPFDPEELGFLRAMAEQAAIAIERARLFDQVSALSVTDPLTGLANRRSLQRSLEREFAAARRGRELVAVMFDLDEFKQYNDAHGHLAGDEVLQAFATALLEQTRAMNVAARYGGDEFVALLSDTGAEGGRAFVQRVRSRFREETAGSAGEVVTVSAGVGVFDPAMKGPQDLVRAADEDLYRQKVRERV